MVAETDDYVAIASDEENQLRIYRGNRGGFPLQRFDLTQHLRLDRHSPETDIEGAARLGEVVYWITSHSRNNEGQYRPNRHRLFATRFHLSGDETQIEFIGVPYRNLVGDLARAPQLKQFNFDVASRLPPKKPGGLNIEGLCATPEGHLLIAFRNPVPNKRALLVPLHRMLQAVAVHGSGARGEACILAAAGRAPALL